MVNGPQQRLYHTQDCLSHSGRERMWDVYMSCRCIQACTLGSLPTIGKENRVAVAQGSRGAAPGAWVRDLEVVGTWAAANFKDFSMQGFTCASTKLMVKVKPHSHDYSRLTPESSLFKRRDLWDFWQAPMLWILDKIIWNFSWRCI